MKISKCLSTGFIVQSPVRSGYYLPVQFCWLTFYEMPSNSQRKHTISTKVRKRPGKDYDQLHEDLKPNNAKKLLNQPVYCFTMSLRQNCFRLILIYLEMVSITALSVNAILLTKRYWIFTKRAKLVFLILCNHCYSLIKIVLKHWKKYHTL